MQNQSQYTHDAHAVFRVLCNVPHEVPPDIRLLLLTVSRLFTRVILLPTRMILHVVIDRVKPMVKAMVNDKEV